MRLELRVQIAEARPREVVPERQLLPRLRDERLTCLDDPAHPQGNYVDQCRYIGVVQQRSREADARRADEKLGSRTSDERIERGNEEEGDQMRAESERA